MNSMIDLMPTCNPVHDHKRREFVDDDLRYLLVEHLDCKRIPGHWSKHTFQNLFSAIQDRATGDLEMLAFARQNTTALEHSKTNWWRVPQDLAPNWCKLVLVDRICELNRAFAFYKFQTWHIANRRNEIRFKIHSIFFRYKFRLLKA